MSDNSMTKDPTQNVRELISLEVHRLDDLRTAEVKRIDERFSADGLKNKLQFEAAERAVAAALDGTKEAINKADVTTDKRFDLLSEKIDAVMSVINKNTGERGIYVTHADLSIAMDKLQTSIEATLRPVVTFMNSQSGRSSGVGVGWMWVVGGISALLALTALVINALRLFGQGL